MFPENVTTTDFARAASRQAVGPGEVRTDGMVETHEQRATLLAAGGRRPELLRAPQTPRYAPRALREPTVYHHVTKGLLGKVMLVGSTPPVVMKRIGVGAGAGTARLCCARAALAAGHSQQLAPSCSRAA